MAKRVSKIYGEIVYNKIKDVKEGKIFYRSYRQSTYPYYVRSYYDSHKRMYKCMKHIDWNVCPEEVWFDGNTEVITSVRFSDQPI